jgi:hypothetical protein
MGEILTVGGKEEIMCFLPIVLGHISGILGLSCYGFGSEAVGKDPLSRTAFLQKYKKNQKTIG